MTLLPALYATAGKCLKPSIWTTSVSKEYAFQIEMKFTAFKCGFHITEVPVIFINRELGTSKMNSSIFGEAVFGVIQLKWDSWFKKYPKTH